MYHVSCIMWRDDLLTCGILKGMNCLMVGGREFCLAQATRKKEFSEEIP